MFIKYGLSEIIWQKTKFYGCKVQTEKINQIRTFKLLYKYINEIEWKITTHTKTISETYINQLLKK